MQASIMMKLPNLTMDGTEIQAAQTVGSGFGLTVQGVKGGPDGNAKAAKDGTVEIFPSARFCVTEAEIISSLYKAVGQLKKEEDAAEEAAAERRRLKANAKEMERHRGYMDEIERQKMAVHHTAATHIQARWRGVEVRIRVGKILEEQRAKAARLQEERRQAAEAAAREAEEAAEAIREMQ